MMNFDDELWWWSLMMNFDDELWWWTLMMNNDDELWWWTLMMNFDEEQCWWTMMMSNEDEQWWWFEGVCLWTHVILRLLRVEGEVWTAAPATVSPRSPRSPGSGESGESGDEFPECTFCGPLWCILFTFFEFGRFASTVCLLLTFDAYGSAVWRSFPCYRAALWEGGMKWSV